MHVNTDRTINYGGGKSGQFWAVQARVAYGNSGWSPWSHTFTGQTQS
jgi:hypothetical protein